jgi:hypothetical protein
MKTLLRPLTVLTLLSLSLALSAQAQNSPLPLEPEVAAPDAEIGTLILSDESALQVLDLLEQLTGKITLVVPSPKVRPYSHWKVYSRSMASCSLTWVAAS